jgi:hypothetical protein
MGQWLSIGTFAFFLLLFLSALSAIVLGGCWVFAVPEPEDGEVTPGGKVLSRARYFLTASCGLIFISLLLDVLVRNPASPSNDWWIWGEHPRVLMLFLVLSSGLAIAASYYAFRSKGDGRWMLWIGAPSLAALSFIGVVCMGQLI